MSDLPPIDYERVQSSRPSGLRLIHYVFIVGIVSLLISILVPTPSRHRLKTGRIMCASNLRQIGQAAMLYAESNQGAFPPDLQTLASSGPIGLETLVCPSSNDNEPQSIGAIASPGGCSYLYVGDGITSKATSACILALEDPAHHGLEGGNILFADGHVDYFDLPTFQRVLNELNAGRNPPATLTPNLSQGGAEQDYEKNWKARMPQLKTGVWRVPATQPANK